MALVGFVAFSAARALLAEATARKAGMAYLPDDALAETHHLDSGEFVLEIPPGPACRVMLRTALVCATATGDAASRYGLDVTVDALREGGDGTPFIERRAWAFGGLAQGGADAVASTTSHAFEGLGREIAQTHVLVELPAGGPAIVRGHVRSATRIDFLAVFAKPV